MVRKLIENTNEDFLCWGCENGNHLACRALLKGGICECIRPIHRLNHEDGDDIYRLAGRLRGCFQAINELGAFGVDLSDPDGNMTGYGKDIVAHLEDIARRLDGIGDNIAVVSHLLANPTSSLVVGRDIIP